MWPGYNLFLTFLSIIWVGKHFKITTDFEISVNHNYRYRYKRSSFPKYIIDIMYWINTTEKNSIMNEIEATIFAFSFITIRYTCSFHESFIQCCKLLSSSNEN